MLRNRILVFSGLAVLAAIVSASALDSVTLTRNAKVGDEASYTLNVIIEIEGMGEFEMVADITDKVMKVEKDGTVTIASSSTNRVIMSGGSPVQEPEDEVDTTTFAKSGKIMKIESSQVGADAYRFASLMNFMWPTVPVDVGSKWKVEMKADSKQGTNDMTFSYSIVERGKLNGHDCFKIKFNNKETSGGGASTEGVTWVDVKTGLMVKIDGDMYGIPMQGMIMDGNFVIELVD